MLPVRYLLMMVISYHGVVRKVNTGVLHNMELPEDMNCTSLLQIGGNYINYYKASGNALRCIRSY